MEELSSLRTFLNEGSKDKKVKSAAHRQMALVFVRIFEHFFVATLLFESRDQCLLNFFNFYAYSSYHFPLIIPHILRKILCMCMNTLSGFA